MIRKEDIPYLERCLELAEEAENAGDEAFGSVLVNAKGEILAEARNKVHEKNRLAHPEYELAAWAADHLSEDERSETILYTTGEHCPMCAAAHGWVGLGTIVYLSSGQQFSEWLKEFGVERGGNVRLLPIQEIVSDIEVRGPGEGEFLNRIKELHKRCFLK